MAEADRFGRTLSDGALSYTYDGNGNPLTITYPGNLQAIYTYDKMDRPISLQSKEGAAAAVYVVKNSPASTYRAYGPLATLVFNTTTNRTETRAYDFRNQPTSITVSGSLFTLSYTTDKVGNITQQQRTLPAPTETRGYGYQDWQYYLTCGSGPWGGTACSPSPTGNPLQWTYDKIGNRATEVRAGLTDSYVYDDNSGATGDTAVLDVVNLGVLGTRDYTFDNGGYLSQIAAGANVLDFTFDAAGELGSVVRGAQSLTNSYDGRGFLQSAADATSGGSVNATYSSSGLLHSLERLPATGGTLERHNVLYFAGRPIAIWKKVGVAAATTTYLVTDHLGTPAYALNQAGTEYWKGGLEPFGRDWQEGTAYDMLTKGIFLRFPGQWDDALFTNATLGADTYYNLHRWFERQTGRYLSGDPVAWYTGEPMLYGYAKSSPLNLTDPFGLMAVPCEGCLPLLVAKHNAQRRIHLLSTTGSDEDPSPGASNVQSAMTLCEGWSPTLGDATTTRYLGKFPDEPCGFLCTGIHERVHRRMCRRLGTAFVMMSLPDREIPAYREELKCLDSAIKNGRLDLSLNGVSY